MRLAPAVALVAVLATSACTVTGRACTDIGASNGVNVTVQGADQTQDLVAEVCVGADCATGTLFAGGTGGDFVDLPAVHSTSAVDVRVTVRSQSGVVVVPATTVRSTPRKVQPNGPGCEPTAFQAAVTVTAS
jgi:hypothetical protein